jgi:hypothetical protein
MRRKRSRGGPGSHTIADAEGAFAAAFRRGAFLSADFLTPGGGPFEPLLGLITAHDLPSATGARVVWSACRGTAPARRS